MNPNDNNPHRYDDMLYLPHHQSVKRPHMSMRDRAAQFSPFAALTGHEAAIAETARLTDKRLTLDEDAKIDLDEKLQFIQENLDCSPVVSITYFVPDEKKEGGAYLTMTGVVRRIDPVAKSVIFTDRRSIQIEDIYAVGGEIFCD